MPGSSGHGRYDATSEAIDVRITRAGKQSIGAVTADGVFHSHTSANDSLLQVATGFGIPSSPGVGGALPVVRARFSNVGTVVFEAGSDEFLAQPGALATPHGEEMFRRFLDPVAGAAADGTPIHALHALVSGAPANRDAGIWSGRAAGHGVPRSLTLLAWEGDEPPGAPGTKWKNFTSLTLQEGRGAMFTATLSPSSTVFLSSE